MFTGIVEETGELLSVKKNHNSAQIEFGGDIIFQSLGLGDSVAVNGVCLTVSALQGKSFWADVMGETLKKSSLNQCFAGQKVNMERAMAANGRFGGHIVSGHIDGTGEIQLIKKESNAVWFQIGVSQKIMKYIIEKGSITIDGISLTVAELKEKSFCVSVIPHTFIKTILKDKKEGHIVNLENDIIGKYVERLIKQNESENKVVQSNITNDFLIKFGF